MWCCETSKKDRNNNTKFSHTKSGSHLAIQPIYRKIIIVTDKMYKLLNLDFDQVDSLIGRAFDGCRQYFSIFKVKCVFVVKFIRETHGTTFYFINSN